MRNRRPEKGPLFMSIATSIFVLIFAIVWTAIAAHAAPFMAFFGIFFIGFAIARIVMTVNHATGRDRRISDDHSEEQVENRYAKPENTEQKNTAQAYCPSCGAKVGVDFLYCGECGRKLPK